MQWPTGVVSKLGYIACGLLQSAFQKICSQKIKESSRASLDVPIVNFFFITQTVFIMLQLLNAIFWSCTVTEVNDQKTGHWSKTRCSFTIVNLFIKQWSGVSTSIKKNKNTKPTNQESNPPNPSNQPTNQPTICSAELLRTYIASNSIYHGRKGRR